ncbi:hypothetical protein B0H14DRAFT_2706542 [Mycena olivaceomarginata]|nr:hypothetical protein B0H14DRAFT_2706542 [Mycena olivaceomarginata]
MRFMANEAMVQARFSRLLEAMSIFANEVRPPTPRRGPFWYHPKVFTCADSESIRPDFVGGKLKHDRTWPFTKKLTAVEIKTPPVMKQPLDKLERKREWQESYGFLSSLVSFTKTVRVLYSSYLTLSPSFMKTPSKSSSFPFYSITKSNGILYQIFLQLPCFPLAPNPALSSISDIFAIPSPRSPHPESQSFSGRNSPKTCPSLFLPRTWIKASCPSSDVQHTPSPQRCYLCPPIVITSGAGSGSSGDVYRGLVMSTPPLPIHTMFDIAQETIQYGKLWSGWEGDGIPKFYGPATVTGGRPEQLALFLEDKGDPVETLSVLGPRTQYLLFSQSSARAGSSTRIWQLAKSYGMRMGRSVIDFAELRPTAQKSEGGG